MWQESKFLGLVAAVKILLSDLKAFIAKGILVTAESNIYLITITVTQQKQKLQIWKVYQEVKLFTE